MRVVIRRDNVRIEFEGRGQIWNEVVRPYLGGPEAPNEPERLPEAPQVAPKAVQAPMRAMPQVQPGVREPAPAIVRTSMAVGAGSVGQAAVGPRPVASQPRTWYPPRPQAPQKFEPKYEPPQHYSAEEDESDAVQVEPSADPATLYARLAAIPGRRSERDAVLAAAWFLTKGERETTSDEVEGHFESLRVFPDLKVVPHLLKHIHRTKMFEQGSGPKAVRFSKKGVASVRGRLVPD